MRNKNIFYTLGIIAFVAFLYFLFLSPPNDFPSGAIVKIEQGKSLRAISLLLKDGHIIRSRTAFEAALVLFGKGRVIATDYYLESKLPVFEVARRMSRGEQHITELKITIPEGFSNAEIAGILATKLVYFDKDKFLAEAGKEEGYLFPDTYYFLVVDNVPDVIKAMKGNFEKKISPLRPEIVSSGRTEKEIIIMASVIEKEAKGDADRNIISGILWKRIDNGMPLQVDAAPETYKAKGLPKSPVGNPGLEAINAAIHPLASPYLYYLHDKTGATHYARTFAEHKRNIAKYLK